MHPILSNLVQASGELGLAGRPCLAVSVLALPHSAGSLALIDVQSLFKNLSDSLGASIIPLAGAISILILGWIVAILLSSAIAGLLKRTSFDNQLATWLGMPAQQVPQIEKWVATIIFWVIFTIALVAFLNTLKLSDAAQPLNNFLNQIFAFLPKLGSAALLAAVAWFVATIAQAAVLRTARALSLDQRLTQSETAPAEGQFMVSETLAKAIYWFVFLFFLPIILGVLDLQGPLAPVQNLLNELLLAVPRIVKAVIIGGIGWLVARTVREILSNLLAALGTDQLVNRLGLSQMTSGQPLSRVIGTVAYVLILLPTVVAALEALEIKAVSQPAVTMLTQVMNAIPLVFTAILILAISFFVGRFISELVTTLLTGIGFNNLFIWLGLPSQLTATTAPTDAAGESSPSDGKMLTPSQIVGVISLVGTMLLAAVAATNVLNFPELTKIISDLTKIFGQILFGVIVLAIGLYLANLVFNLILATGGRQSRILANTARIAIIILVTAMALQQMGIASNIVNLAFGLLMGAIAVAIALAFGLGGRDIAAEQIREWLNSFKQNQ